MALTFKKASKAQARLRLALSGGPGDGKTWSALTIATHLVPGGRIAVIDTEHGSAAKYANLFEFDALELDSFSPALYIEAIQVAEKAKYDVIIIDSLSHAWAGKDGALEQKDRAASRTGNSWTAWRDITPLHNAMIEAIVGCRSHVIATLRAKVEYVQEAGEGGRKASIRRLGMSPVQREGVDFEFDVVGMLNTQHEMEITKSRCPDLSGKYFSKPGEEFAGILRAWLTDGTPAPEPKPRAELPATPVVTSAPPSLDPAGDGPVPDAIVNAIENFGGRITIEQAAGIACDEYPTLQMDDRPLADRALCRAANCKAAQFKREMLATLTRYINASRTVAELAEVMRNCQLIVPVGSPAYQQLSAAFETRKVQIDKPPTPPNGGGTKPETAPSDNAVNGAAMQSADELPATQLRDKLAECTALPHLFNALFKHGPALGVSLDEAKQIAADRLIALGKDSMSALNIVSSEIRDRGWKATKRAA